MVLTAAISALHQNIYTTKHTLITCTIMTIMILTTPVPFRTACPQDGEIVAADEANLPKLNHQQYHLAIE